MSTIAYHGSDNAAPASAERPRLASSSMTTLRRWLINALILGLLGCAAYDIVRDREHWPMSNYPMYSVIEREYTFSSLRVYAVPLDPNIAIFPLTPGVHLAPYDPGRLEQSFMRMRDAPNREELLTRALASLLARYETLRVGQQADWPQLYTLRIYQDFWYLDPWARNVDQPDRHELIFELNRPLGQEG